MSDLIALLREARTDAQCWLDDYRDPDSDWNFTDEERAYRIPWYEGVIQCLDEFIAAAIAG